MFHLISSRKTEQCRKEEKVEESAYECLGQNADKAEVDVAGEQSKSSLCGISIT